MIMVVVFFFFNDTATTEIYTLSLHDALPISQNGGSGARAGARRAAAVRRLVRTDGAGARRPDRGDDQGRAGAEIATIGRSEEHTSELQSRQYLVCRLLLEKKK